MLYPFLITRSLNPFNANSNDRKTNAVPTTNGLIDNGLYRNFTNKASHIIELKKLQNIVIFFILSTPSFLLA